MKTFKQFINEVGNKPARWKWTKSNASVYQAEFRIGDKGGYKMEIKFHSQDEEIPFWSVHFEYIADIVGVGTYRDTGTGNSLQVFATVLDILKTFIAKEKPKAITFSGKDGRQKIYARILKYIKGYEMYKEKIKGSEVGFTLMRGRVRPPEVKK